MRKQNELKAELNVSWLLGLGWMGLLHPSLSSLHPGRPWWAGAGSPFPKDRYLMPWSCPATIFPDAAGGPSGAGARVSGGSRSHTLPLGKTGGGKKHSDPWQDAPCPRGLHRMCQRRRQDGHCCLWHDEACWWVSTEPGRNEDSLG